MNTPTACAPVLDVLDALGPIQLPQAPAVGQRAALLAGMEQYAGSVHGLTIGVDITTTSF